MSFVSIGDLAQGFALRSQNAEVKARLNRLSAELASGRTADPAARVRGDFRPLAAIERSLTVMDAYDLATSEAALAGEAMQGALEQLTGATQTLGPDLLEMSTLHDGSDLRSIGAQAREWLGQAVAALNTHSAGRSLFAGATTDVNALASADDILAEVSTAVSGLTTASDVLSAIDSWFDTGGGFETMGYTGSTDPTGAVRVADGQSLSLDITAADPEIRDVLKSLVTGALLADDTVLPGDLTERGALCRAAGEGLLSADGPLTTLRADLGSIQSRIESIQTENASTRSAYEIARSDILDVDPYDTATQLQATETQLETLYAVTARLSRLSLANYMS